MAMAKATDHLSKQFSVLAFHNINMIIAKWDYDMTPFGWQIGGRNIERGLKNWNQKNAYM